MLVGEQVRVEALPEQVPAVRSIARRKGAAIASEETVSPDRVWITLTKN